MKKMGRSKPQKGFTLLETMIAMAVLSFGILSLIGVFTQGLQASSSEPDAVYCAAEGAGGDGVNLYSAR